MKQNNKTLTTITTKGMNRVYENIHFYKDNTIVLSIESAALQLYRISDNGLFNEVSSYDTEIKEIIITEPKRANKLNLNRKDNFYFKNQYNTWGIEKYYDLYIYCGAGGDAVVKPAGEKLCNEYDGEKHFKNAYEVTLVHGYNIKKYIIDKYPMENPESYKLQPGEKIGDWYGTKNAPIISTYDTENSIFRKKAGMKPEKGILKKYRVNETLTEAFLTAPRCYTRYEKSPERAAADRLLNTLNEKAGLNITRYQFEKMLQIVNITLK